jgi:hypothetical protein
MTYALAKSSLLRHALIVASVASAASLIACAGTATSTPDEATGETAGALGEAACGTVALTSSVIGSYQAFTVESGQSGYCPDPHTLFGRASAFPNGSAYGGYGSPDCPNQYVMEVENVGNMPYSGHAFISPHAELPANWWSDPKVCMSVHTELALYGKAIGASTFTLLGTQTQAGGRIQNGECVMVPTSSTGTLSILSGQYQAVRVVGDTYYVTTTSKGATTSTYAVPFIAFDSTPPCDPYP